MKRALALITAACMATPALANSDVIAGVIFGTVLGHAMNQPRQVIVQPQPPVIVQQPVIIQQAPIIVEPSYSCPPGTRAFWRRGYMQDSYGRLTPVNYLECNS
jgi:hypothetical protein